MNKCFLDSTRHRIEGRVGHFKAVLGTSAGVCRGSLGVPQREDMADEAIDLSG